jgi:hypothetical protein
MSCEITTQSGVSQNYLDVILMLSCKQKHRSVIKYDYTRHQAFFSFIPLFLKFYLRCCFVNDYRATKQHVRSYLLKSFQRFKPSNTVWLNKSQIKFHVDINTKKCLPWVIQPFKINIWPYPCPGRHATNSRRAYPTCVPLFILSH